MPGSRTIDIETALNEPPSSGYDWGFLPYASASFY